MRRRPRRKGFSGLIRYGQARYAMYAGWAANVRNMEREGWSIPLEAIESRANMQRTFRKKRFTLQKV